MAEQPKIVTYMGSLYERMVNEASEVTEEGREPVLVWQGKLIATCTSVDIPQGYYKKVVDALRNMGCIEMMSQGRRGSAPTTIVLRNAPTLELYEEAIVKSDWDTLTSAPSPDSLLSLVKDIQEKTGGLHIPSILVELDGRLKAVEAALGLTATPQDQSNNSTTTNKGDST